MDNTLTSFILGFIATATLFLLSLVIVSGVKSVWLFVKDCFFVNKSVGENDKPKTNPQKARKKTMPNPVRSLEIDPSTVDRISFKKIS